MKTIETMIEIDASPEEVWDVLVDFPSHARWNPLFARVSGSAVVGEKINIAARKPDDSEGMEFTPVILDVDAGTRLRWKGKLLVKGIFDGEHIYELAAIPGGRTRFDHSENFSGLLIPLMGKLLAETERGFHAFNKALEQEVAARRDTLAS